MSTVALFEAKQHLSQLVERVEKGESIEITKRGIVVARLVPRGRSRESSREATQKIREVSRGLRLGSFSVRKLIEEGRA